MRLVACLCLLALAADAGGTWSGTLALADANGIPDRPDPFLMVLQQDGDKLTGACGPDQKQQWPLRNGKIAGDRIVAEVTSPDGAFYQIVASLDADRITGLVTVTAEGRSRKAQIDLKRAPGN